MSESTSEVNAAFGSVTSAPEVPPVNESLEAREARVRAQAQAIVAQESEADMLKRFVEEEKAKLREALLPQDSSGLPADYDKIRLYAGEGRNALSYATPGVNGLTFKIPRDEDVIIPNAITKALDTAVEEITIQGPHGLITRPSHRFPYQFKGKATKEEYQAYRAGQLRKKAMEEAAVAGSGH